MGAGVPATDAGELEYTYEKNLKVLPSFAVIPNTGAMGGLGSAPGLTFNLASLLHGENDIEIHRPLPPEAKIRSVARVAQRKCATCDTVCPLCVPFALSAPLE